MVRDRVMRFGHANERIRAIGLLAAQQQREDARHVGLKRQRRQIEHQLRVLIVGFGRANRTIGQRDRRLAGLPLGDLNASLNLAHRVEVFRHSGAVRRAQTILQAGNGFLHRIEDAAIFANLSQPLRRRSTVAEHPLEDDARIHFHRQRRCRVAPRHRVPVDAAVAVVAVADEIVLLQRHLDRQERRVFAEHLRRDLIDGRSGLDVRALGALRMDA